MKLPEFLLIGDSIWSVKLVRKIDYPRHKVRITVGLADPETCVISLKKSLSTEDKLEYFVHELIHALDHEYDLNIPHKLVYKLQKPIADFLRANFL